MPKGYWMGHIEVHDPETYKKYVEGATPAYREYGAKFLARGGAFDQPEGEDLGGRHVIIEFDSYEKALACYNCDTYQQARKHRLAASNGRLVVVEGVE